MPGSAINLHTPVNSGIVEKIALLQQLDELIPAITIVHDVKATQVVYMSSFGLKLLGVSMEELKAMGPSYHDRFFDAEFAKLYIPRILGLLERNNNDEIISYFQQVRTSENEEWRWFLSCTRIFMRDEEKNPLYIITNAIPLDAAHFLEAAKAKRLLEESVFLNKNNHLFNNLSKREKEILKMMALGLSAGVISKTLFISEMTVNTHRRNIKRKLNIENSYDATRFAHAFGLI